MDAGGPLSDFFEAISEDARIRPTHISLYVALLQQCCSEGGKNPVVITRRALMSRAKISSRQTYNQGLRELHDYGYVRYVPSCHPLLGSLVYLRPL